LLSSSCSSRCIRCISASESSSLWAAGSASFVYRRWMEREEEGTKGGRTPGQIGRRKIELVGGTSREARRRGEQRDGRCGKNGPVVNSQLSRSTRPACHPSGRRGLCRPPHRPLLPARLDPRRARRGFRPSFLPLYQPVLARTTARPRKGVQNGTEVEVESASFRTEREGRKARRKAPSVRARARIG
jgi:hypothetical protein